MGKTWIAILRLVDEDAVVAAQAGLLQLELFEIPVVGDPHLLVVRVHHTLPEICCRLSDGLEGLKAGFAQGRAKTNNSQGHPTTR